MKALALLGALIVGLAGLAAPASARDQYVLDNAHLFSAAAVQATNAKIADFNAQTHKEVFVYTTASLDGATPQAAAERVFAQQQINGVLIFIAKSPKTIGIIPDRSSASYFPSGSTKSIRDAIAANFNSGNLDAGLQNGVDLTLNMYRSHLRALPGNANRAPAVSYSAPNTSQGGFNMGWIFLILIFVVGFLILRAIFRAIFAPRMPMGGPMGGQMGGPGYGPGYGGPMMGGGMMGGGGGGSFWSGLLGGLGGAFLGNELFRGGGFGGGGFGGGTAGMDPGVGGGNAGDASGFQSDPGQADMGNASFGGWGGGDSGGGGWGDTGGGGGDFGGGGGGDSGGGGW